MSILDDTMTLFLREMLIFKKNIGPGIARTLMFPIIFILLLGSIGNIPKHVPVAVVNYDGAASLKFMNQLTSGDSLSVTSVTNQQQAISLLADGNVAAVVVIPAGFSTNPSSDIYVYTDASSSSSSVASSTVSEAAAALNAKLVPKERAGRGRIGRDEPRLRGDQQQHQLHHSGNTRAGGDHGSHIQRRVHGAAPTGSSATSRLS